VSSKQKIIPYHHFVAIIIINEGLMLQVLMMRLNKFKISNLKHLRIINN